MKCNWCGEGEGRNYTKSYTPMNTKTYFYYCYECIGDIEKELNQKRRNG